MDIAPEKIAEVLPNAENFEEGTTLPTRAQAFQN
jgi:hypothetical protein